MPKNKPPKKPKNKTEKSAPGKKPRPSGPEHDAVVIQVMTRDVLGRPLSNTGLVEPEDFWADFTIEEFLRDAPATAFQAKLSGHWEIVAKLSPPEDREFPPDFDPSDEILLFAEVDEKGLSVTFEKHALSLASLVKERFFEKGKNIRVIFCLIFGPDVVPTEREAAFVSRFSSPNVDFRFHYVSLTKPHEFFAFFKSKLEAGEVPLNLEFVKFLYLPMVVQNEEDGLYR
jgi:hypothetical protein